MINADRRAKTVMATSTHVEVGVLDQRVLLRHHAIEARGTVLFSLDDVPPRCAQRITPDAVEKPFQRLLKGPAADADDPDEYFDADTGELKLACVGDPKTFKGMQKNVIAVFWKARQQHSLKWSEVVTRTRCGKDPDSVFGPEWSTWLERIEGQRGHYRLRTRR